MEEAVSSLTLGPSRVRLKIIYLKDLPSLSDRIDRHWEQMVAAAGDRFPGMIGWLTEAKYQLTGERNLEILVRNKAGVEYLERRREELTELFRDLVFEDLILSFTVGDFTEAIIRDQLRQEQAQARLQALALQAQPVTAKGAKSFGNNKDIIYGKKFNQEPIPIKQLTEEADGVVVHGEIFRFESRTARSGKKFYLGDLTDYTDSVSFKIFPRNSDSLEERLKEGAWVKVRGNLQFDPYTKELSLLVTDILPGKSILTRSDQAAEKRVELHLHTKMSAMDATVDAAKAINLAAAWGHPAIAVTDHGVVHSFPEVAGVAKKAGIKVIYGMEGYLVDDGVPIVVGASDERMEDLQLVVFDIETTGFNPLKEDLLEIGAVKYRNGVRIEEFSSLIKPDKVIPEEIQKLTGITPEMVDEAPTTQEVLISSKNFAPGRFWRRIMPALM